MGQGKEILEVDMKALLTMPRYTFDMFLEQMEVSKDGEYIRLDEFLKLFAAKKIKNR